MKTEEFKNKREHYSEWNSDSSIERYPAVDTKLINYKRIIFSLIAKWYWFVIGAIIAVICTFVFFHLYWQDTFSVQATIVLKPDHVEISDNRSSQNNLFIRSTIKNFSILHAVNNDIELLKSYNLSRKVSEKLGWRTFWYQKKSFKWESLFTKEPFILTEDKGKNNTEGLMLKIKPIENERYIISANGTVKNTNGIKHISFADKVKFGKPFQNKYFHFTLKQKYPKQGEGKEYYFMFCNQANLAKDFNNNEIIVPAGKETDVINLILKGREPLRGIVYLNKLIEEYKELRFDLRTEAIRRSLNFINNEITGIAGSLKTESDQVTKFRTDNQVIDLSEQGIQIMNQLTDIEKEWSDKHIQLDYFQNLLTHINNTDSIKKMAMPSVVGIEDKSLEDLVLKLTDLYNQKEELTFSTHDNNPTIILINRKIQQVSTQISGNVINLIKDTRLNLKNLSMRKDTINQSLTNLPLKEQELIRISRKYEITNDLYTFILQKKMETEIGLSSMVSDVQIINPASSEQIAHYGLGALPKNIFYLIALIIGLIIPGIIICFIEYINETIRYQTDIEKLTSLTIAGNIPHTREKSYLSIHKNPKSSVAESYRGLRTNLQELLEKPEQKVIGIHSLLSGEGKTFSAISLSCIIAMNGKKVVLIEANMRKPRLSSIFNEKNEQGLSSYLIGLASYEKIIFKTKIPNLSLIPAGPIPPNPAELLDRNQYKELITQARKDFDYIIVCNTPVSFITDGIITGKQTDLNIFVLRYKFSHSNELKFIKDLACQRKISNVALLINDVKKEYYDYDYSPYHSL